MAEPSAGTSLGSDDSGPELKKIKIDLSFLPNDVILRVEDQRLYVNRDLLVSASPVFEAMLKKEWQGDKQTDSGKVELSLPGKSAKDMKTFLRCLLPSYSDRVSVETLETVLPLADEYQTETLLPDCFNAMESHIRSVFRREDSINVSQIVKYIHWVDHFKPDKIVDFKADNIKKCVVNLAACEELGVLEAEEEFANIGQELKMVILRQRNKFLERLFVLTPSEIEETIHPEIPRGDLHHILSYFLSKRKSKVSNILFYTLNAFDGLGNSPSKYTVPKELSRMFSCLTVAGSLSLDKTYSKCMEKLNKTNITKELFEKYWRMEYQSGRNAEKEVLEKHLSKLQC